MNRKPPERAYRKTVATCVTEQQYRKLKVLADASQVRMSTYFRSIIVDAIADAEATGQLSLDKVAP